jgi:DNA-binding response OmpR family regulator
MVKNKFDILVIEDNMPDYDLFINGMNRSIKDKEINYYHVTDGNFALDFLYKRNKYQNSPTPSLIILDLNLPSISGQEVLKTIKCDKKLSVIPVIVLSTSESEKDILESYELYANSYIIKTFDIDELFKKIKSLSEYWLTTTELPDIINIVYIDNKENP